MNSKYFGPKSFYKEAILIAIPVMLQQLVQSLVNLIDNFMVAGLGDVKMSGVNTAGTLIFAFQVLYNTICISGGVYLTQHFGAKNKKGMQQALCFKIVLISIACLLFMLMCSAFPSQVISIMLNGNSEAEAIIYEGTKYMKIISLIGIPMAISYVTAGSLREIGNVNPPLVITIIATIVNTFFNYMLIYGNFGAPRLEVEGAAIATVIARCVECLLFIIYTKIKKPPFAIKFDTLFHIDWKMFKEILVKASMILFSEMLWVISETVTTALYNSRGGADVVSGMASSFTIANLFFISFNGITSATGVIIGKTLGQGNLEEAKRQKNWLFMAAIIFGFIMLGIALTNTLLVPVVFGNLSLSAQKICRGMVITLALYMPLWVYQNTQFALSRAGGDAKMGFMVDGIFTIGMYFPLIFILALFTDLGPVYLYAIAKLTDIPKVIYADWWLKKEKWVKNLAQ